MDYALFDTAFGMAGIAWSERGLTRMLLPDRTPAKTERCLQESGAKRCRDGRPAFADRALQELASYLQGADIDLGGLPLDDSSVTTFNRSIYQILRQVPRGETVTYGALAQRVGKPGAARAVGIAMGKNPWPVIVPCHRVLAAGGKVGGFSAPGGRAMKEKLLALEGVTIGVGVQPGLFDDRPRS